MEKFNCSRCGACCRYHKCKYLLENNLCEIYETRPERCRVDKIGIPFNIVKNACNLLRIKEWIDPLIEGMYDKKYEQERRTYVKKGV